MIDRRLLLSGSAALLLFIGSLAMFVFSGPEKDIRNDVEWEAFWTEWQAALASDNPEDVADLARFPLQTSKGRCDRAVFLATIVPELRRSVALTLKDTTADAVPTDETERRVLAVPNGPTLGFGPAPEGWRLVQYLID